MLKGLRLATKTEYNSTLFTNSFLQEYNYQVEVTMLEPHYDFPVDCKIDNNNISFLPRPLGYFLPANQYLMTRNPGTQIPKYLKKLSKFDFYFLKALLLFFYNINLLLINLFISLRYSV